MVKRNMFETTTRIICVCFFLNPTAVVPLIFLPTICNKMRFMFGAELRRRLTIDNLYNPHLLERTARETVFFCFSSAHVQRVLSLWGLGKIGPIGKHDVTSRILLLRELSIQVVVENIFVKLDHFFKGSGEQNQTKKNIETTWLL